MNVKYQNVFTTQDGFEGSAAKFQEEEARLQKGEYTARIQEVRRRASENSTSLWWKIPARRADLSVESFAILNSAGP